MTSQIYTLKPLDEGADPATFYAPLGCATPEGRLYRGDIQYKGMAAADQAIWNAQEMWRIEACFFAAADGLSGWQRFAPSIGRGWFVPINTEAVIALGAYMDKLQPASALRQRLEDSEETLIGARQWAKRSSLASAEGAKMSADQRRASERVQELEDESGRITHNLRGAEAQRLEAQIVLLAALGWERLLEATKGGSSDG